MFKLSFESAMIFLKNFLRSHLYRFGKKKPLLSPLFFTWYANFRCNFRCSYCDFFYRGDFDKGGNSKELSTERTIELFRIMREACPHLYITGGEPLLRKDIVQLLEAARKLNFVSVSLNTNMSLVARRPEVLDYLDYLVASWDEVHEDEFAKFKNSAKSEGSLKDTIAEYAQLQKEKKFRLVVNCVVTKESISRAREIMWACLENGVNFAIVPAELDGGWPDEGLGDNVEFKRLVEDLIKAKKEGKTIFGSFEYLATTLDFKPFDCNPTATPHVYPNGDLLYPCQPMLKTATNLLKEGSYGRALKKARMELGPVPNCKRRCYKACYVEPSIFTRNPLLFARELILG